MFRRLCLRVCVRIFACVFVASFTSPSFGQVIIAEKEPQSAARKKIEAALDEKASLSVFEKALGEVIGLLKERHKIPIVIDEVAITDAGASSDTPITCDIKDVSLRSLLSLVLHDHGLTTIIKNETLLVTSREVVESTLTTRFYVVKDLARPEKDSDEKSSGKYAYLQELIPNHTGTIDSWAELGGGYGVISCVEHLAVIVVTHTDEIHREIELFLESLRQAKNAIPENGSPSPSR